MLLMKINLFHWNGIQILTSFTTEVVFRKSDFHRNLMDTLARSHMRVIREQSVESLHDRGNHTCISGEDMVPSLITNVKRKSLAFGWYCW